MKQDILKYKERKVLIKPFTYIHDSVFVDSIKMLVMLSLHVFMLVCTKSYKSLVIICAAVIGTLFANIISEKIFMKKKGSLSFSIIISFVQGIITGMLIPEQYPFITVFLVSVFSVFFINQCFGGFSNSWINSSAITVCILWFIGAVAFPQVSITFDMLSVKNPSNLLIENGLIPICRYDSSITDALNNVVFSLFKVSIPEGYVSFFWDSGALIPAFRFNFLTLISSIVLFSDDLSKLIPVSFFIVIYVVLIRFVSPLFTGNISIRGDMLLALLSGGTLFIATFVFAWYGTIPQTIVGKLLYGTAGGITAFFVSGCGTSPVGMIFTVLVSNIISILIQQFEIRNDRLRVNRLISVNNNLLEEN